MQQELQHSFSVGVTRDQAWSFLWNIEAVAKCIPGCEEVIVQEQEKSYKARVRRHVGPFLIRLELDIAVVQSTPPRSFQVVVSGEDKRLRSQVRQSVTVSLEETEGGRCQIGLEASFQLSGMLASLGAGLLGAQIQQELELFAGCVQSSLEREAASPAVD
jgi:uncharacterized protein